MNEIRELQVGDYLYDYGQWGGIYRHKVVRLTNTQAILTNGNKVKKKLSQNSYDKHWSARKIGSYGSFLLETPELIVQFEEYQQRKKVIELFESIKWKELPKYRLSEVIEFLSTLVNKPNDTAQNP